MTDLLQHSSSALLLGTLRDHRTSVRYALAGPTGRRLGRRIHDLRTHHGRIPLTFTITHEDIR